MKSAISQSARATCCDQQATPPPFFDVCSGWHPRDPLSLQRIAPWEPTLGTFADTLRDQHVAVAPNWGGTVISPDMWDMLSVVADEMIARHQCKRVDIETALPSMGAAWSISGMLEIHAALGDPYPACADELTPEIKFGLASTVGK